jgi:hypothetical protein
VINSCGGLLGWKQASGGFKEHARIDQALKHRWIKTAG